MRIGYPVVVQLGLPFGETTAAAPAAGAVTSPAPAAPTAAPAADSPLGAVYFIRHHRARRYLLRVDLDGRVRVTIPRGGSRREADRFARRHVDWVGRQRATLAPSCISLEERQELKRRARRELPSRLHALAAEQGLIVNRVSIRNQRTRWGSCGRDGHICLNWRLVTMPGWVSDYVIIHELMHLKRMDHSPAYWRLVASACPSYREARQWLRSNGPALR